MNIWGQLGDGTLAPYSFRAMSKVVSGLQAIEIAAGPTHTCARKADRAVVCWGDNADGQLGDGTLTNRSSPTPVQKISGAERLALGLGTTCVKIKDGAVVDIAGGMDGICARKADGVVQCWGDNGFGQLGDGSIHRRRGPAGVRW
jgi:alpha-tubulin suppressor-like RCC1 family protein